MDVFPVPRSREASEIDKVAARATEVIGDRDEALRWMGTPIRVLGYSTPVSLLSTAEGEARVLAVLDQLQHGVL
jgi:putative toxin-antitoxin system antitoxin component (TIGR02293 family)